MSGFNSQLDLRIQRLILTLVAKKYLFTVLMIAIWYGKMAPEGWMEILTFVAATMGIDVYQKRLGVNGLPQQPTEGG